MSKPLPAEVSTAWRENVQFLPNNRFLSPVSCDSIVSVMRSQVWMESRWVILGVPTQTFSHIGHWKFNMAPHGNKLSEDWKTELLLCRNTVEAVRRFPTPWNWAEVPGPRPHSGSTQKRLRLEQAPPRTGSTQNRLNLRTDYHHHAWLLVSGFFYTRWTFQKALSHQSTDFWKSLKDHQDVFLANLRWAFVFFLFSPWKVRQDLTAFFS